jgi:hypothetical protein
MKTILHSALLAGGVLAAAGACAAEPAPTAQPYQIVTRLGVSTTTFGCVEGNIGTCHYLILKSLCQEKMLDHRTKERTCQYMEAVPPFKLAPGEKRTVGNLPADYLFTMKVNATPTVDEVLKSPSPH